MLDDASRALVERVRGLGAPPVHEAGAEQARAGFRARQLANPPGPELASVRDRSVAAPGRAPVPVRIHEPADARGVVCFLHGGGWVLGDLDGFEGFSRRLAAATGAAVVTVDYRLAPEHPFPAALEDAATVLAWIGDSRDELPEGPLVVLGESSGGNLAAGVLREPVAGGAAVDALVLVYPVGDHDFDRPSYLDPENQLLVDRTAMRWFWDQYVPDPATRDDVRASPLRGNDFAGWPPVLVIAAEHDVLRDEVDELAARLGGAGVATTTRTFAGQLHGFFTNPLLPASEEALGEVAGWLREVTSG